MYHGEMVFSKIIDGTIPSRKVYEDDHVLAFHDIEPKADVHVLIIPKKKYVSFNDFTQEASDTEISSFYRTIQKIAEDLGIADSGYRLITNHGANAGQEVFHFHVHMIVRRHKD
jgi:diadenosine tetraphosphate (Ap4A) HIT family hydrolase